ncbi:RecT family recombinase [Hymenobacter nivis]|uniref:Phage recombination protein Bet n=1 Tax=Hymenobacter nivis TaxID=1850093 RepID=A0A2Z3GD32_9BACT|nr:RecT family recombinase [Hymenobacter nivis]AWM31333.1 hypothetical protein DDQ68_00155 [Hymenobacter nivis]
METALAKKGKAELAEQISFSPEQLQLMKNTVAKGATDDEFMLFMHLAKTYGLDPFAKEIWLIKYLRAGQRPEEVAATIFTSRDGYLKIASRDVQMDGIQSDVVCANDLLEKLPDGTVKHAYGQPRGLIIGAYALVFRKDRSRAAYFYAPFAEYGTGNNPTWKKYPSAMIVKVAEAMALKRAFSISGLVTQEEIGLDMAPESTPEAETSAVVVASPDAPKKAAAGAPTSAAPAPLIGAAPGGEDELEQVRKRIIQQLTSRHITPGERSRMMQHLNRLDLPKALAQSAKIAECVEYRPSPQALKEARAKLEAFAHEHAAALGEARHGALVSRSKALTVTAVDLLTEIEQAQALLEEGKEVPRA